MSPCTALEYAQILCAASTSTAIFGAASGTKDLKYPGRTAPEPLIWEYCLIVHLAMELPMFTLLLDLHMSFVPPMSGHRGVVLTRELKLPFAPVEDLIIFSKA